MEKLNALVNIPVFEPTSTFIVFWDLFQINIILLILIWLPYKISFDTNYISDLIEIYEGHSIIEDILVAILSVDVFIGCNLAFIKKGLIIRKRSQILANYLKRNTIVDIFSLTSVIFSFFI
jgi:hypothetical protein